MCAVRHSGHFIVSSHVGFREERIRTVSNYELSTLVQHSYTNMANKCSLCSILVSEFWKKLKWSWIIKLGKKDLSGLAVLKSFFCVWKVVSHFCNVQFFFANQYFQTIGNCRWPSDYYLQHCPSQFQPFSLKSIGRQYQSSWWMLAWRVVSTKQNEMTSNNIPYYTNPCYTYWR